MDNDLRSDDMLPDLPAELTLAPKPAFSYDALLPKPANLGLSSSERAELVGFQRALVVLGAAAGGVLVCPGNQEGIPDDRKCPYAAKCPLLRMKKAPAGDLCPIERVLVEERFSSWCRRLGQEPDELTEDARVAVGDLVMMDIQEQRCVNILATGEAARLTQVNVTEAINYTDSNDQQQVLPLTWERVLHVNTERLDNIQDRRRMILKDWMLTEEQRWKVAKAEGKAKGTDLGSKQSQRGDKLRKLDPAYE